MKKVTLILCLLVIVTFAFSQDFGGTYPNCINPAGYTFGQGAQIGPYKNPLKVLGCAGGNNDCGIISPSVDEHPVNIIFPPVPIPAGSTSLSRCFNVFVFDDNLNCSTNSNFPCSTYVTAYIVSSTYISTTAPSPSQYFGKSASQLILAFGASNCISVSFSAGTPPAPNTQYRVFIEFTNSQNCSNNSQNGTKYIIDILPGSGPLPIRLVTFNGVKEVNKVQLHWQTSSEQNSNYFDVEFSENGYVWNKIGKVKAAGNSNVQRDYALTHNSPANGVNYYRLKQADFDNIFGYSNIVAINFAIKGVNINSVYPNPFISQLKIDISSDKNEVIRIQFSDNLGRVLKTLNTSIHKGVNRISLDDLRGLTPGIYTVEVKTSYSTFRYKLKK